MPTVYANAVFPYVVPLRLPSLPQVQTCFIATGHNRLLSVCYRLVSPDGTKEYTSVLCSILSMADKGHRSGPLTFVIWRHTAKRPFSGLMPAGRGAASASILEQYCQKCIRHHAVGVQVDGRPVNASL